MTAMVLRWRKPDPLLVLQWRGPDDSVSATAQANPDAPIATIIGPPGSGASAGPLIACIAGEAVGGHRVVAIRTDGKAYHVSPSDAEADSVAGLTTGAAILGDIVSITAGGEVSEPSWSWTPGSVWLGANGTMTQTVPTSGAIVRIGTALSATAIYVEPRIIARL